ncbi:MAG TPA: TonB-dependent receptor [Pyrinomonadaceae bacterium]
MRFCERDYLIVRALALLLPARTTLIYVCILFSLLTLDSPVIAATGMLPQSLRVQGVVLDQRGAPIVDAQVSVSAQSKIIAQITTDSDGRFVFDALPEQSITLKVQARGFASAEQKWSGKRLEAAPVEIVLAPAPISEQVTVTTATRTETRLAETAASVVVLSRVELSTTAALTIDDALRQVPGFQLFRRSGSRTANPTSQGVSLRGTGASGASRAVVLADGIPLNDPFGGWVYWGRVPREAVGSVEILRGGSSDLYGSGALGGVVQLLSRPVAAQPTLSLEASYGNEQTPTASLFASSSKGQWGAKLAAELFHTDGYILVDEQERGTVDTPAGARHATLDLTLERKLERAGRLFLRAAYYGESRTNGTPLQTNRTHIRQMSAGADWSSKLLGSFSARAYLANQIYDQNFSAVSADRNSETLTRVQRVPAQVAGFSAQWSRAIGPSHTLVAGLDAREVRGTSDELVFVQNRVTSRVGAGGRERDLGLFAEDIFRVTDRLFITGGLRIDRWRNYAARATTESLRPLGQAATVNQFPDRTETALSPLFSVLYKPTERISLSAAAYRAFRQPTLNELYRSFRVGDVLTIANEQLRAERLTGGEAGASVASFNRRLNLRGTFFWSETTRPIANVTLSVAPTLITRQRQNLGRTRSRGVELEAEARIGERWNITGGYLFSDATVVRFPANIALEGLLIPQVPRHQLTFQLSYAKPSFNAGVQGRINGAQYDDDQNRFRLDSYFSIDALASRRIAHNLYIFAAAENLFNQRYETGRTPVVTLGPPLLVRVGFRLRLGSQ